MLRDRRKYAMISSPFMVAYGNVLLTFQYIWSINLHNSELPVVSGFLERKEPPELASKVSIVYLAIFSLYSFRQDFLHSHRRLSLYNKN